MGDARAIGGGLGLRLRRRFIARLIDSPTSATKVAYVCWNECHETLGCLIRSQAGTSPASRRVLIQQSERFTICLKPIRIAVHNCMNLKA